MWTDEHANRYTDSHDEANSRSSQFCNRAYGDSISCNRKLRFPVLSERTNSSNTRINLHFNKVLSPFHAVNRLRLSYKNL